MKVSTIKELRAAIHEVLLNNEAFADYFDEPEFVKELAVAVTLAVVDVLDKEEAS